MRQTLFALIVALIFIGCNGGGIIPPPLKWDLTVSTTSDICSVISGQITVHYGNNTKEGDTSLVINDIEDGTQIAIDFGAVKNYTTPEPISFTILQDTKKVGIYTYNPPLVSCKIHGLCFGPFVKDGQNPALGSIVSEAQVCELLIHIAAYVEWVRTYGCSGGLEYVGEIAHALGLKVAYGAWISTDLVANQEQIDKLIELCNAGDVDIAIIGSEVLLRGDLTAAELIAYINQVKAAIPANIPVTTDDVYSLWLTHPELIQACDLILMNVYSYWEGVKLENAMESLHETYCQVWAVAGGKEIIVGETGWPSCGDTIGEAIPSPINAAYYFQNFVSWAEENEVDYFYFEAFDEPWKATAAHPQEACWGIWDKDGNMKAGMQAVFDCERMDNNWGDPCQEPIEGPCPPEAPPLRFTYVPPIGSYDNLKGQVCDYEPADYRIAVYIKVGSGWWTKPYWDSPLTIIQSDGSWSCDFTTGGNDPQATKIAAYLVPVDYDPPLMSGGSTLPQELEDNSVAKAEVTREQIRLK